MNYEFRSFTLHPPPSTPRGTTAAKLIAHRRRGAEPPPTPRATTAAKLIAHRRRGAEPPRNPRGTYSA